MKTFDQLEAVTTLQDAAILVANNADNTATNKITYANLKAQMLASAVYTAGAGLTLNNKQFAVDLKSPTTSSLEAISMGNTASRQYAVGLDTNGDLSVNIPWTDTWTAMTGATSSENGTAGYVPAPPSDGYDSKYLKADGTWSTLTQITVDSALSTTSENPVQNKVINTALGLKANTADLGTAAAKDIQDTYSAISEDAISGKGVAAALATLPEPMYFKGSLGTGGTITDLPAPASSGTNKNNGFTYKVITDGTYGVSGSTVTAKVGDTVISTGSEWIVIPSGDEPSGTVTSVGLTGGNGINITGGPVTSSGSITVSHDDTSSQESVTNTGRTYIQSVELDEMGHVVSLSSATETVVDTTYTPASLGFGYGTCSTAAGTTAKTVSMSNFVLTVGGIISIKFTAALDAGSTLEVNGTGVVPIYYQGSAVTSSVGSAGDTITMMYDGTNFNIIGIIPISVEAFDGGDEG